MAELKEYKMKLDEDGLPKLCISESRMKYHVDRRCVYDDQSMIYSLIRDTGCLDDAEESMWLLCLDVRLKPQAVFRVSEGTDSLCTANIKGIFQRALMAGASFIVVWHNHPSGDTEPSRQDIETTRQLIKAGKLLDIDLADHMIVSRYGYTSLRTDYPDLGWS